MNRDYSPEINPIYVEIQSPSEWDWTPISIEQTQQGYHIYVCGLKNDQIHIDILYFIAFISNPIFFDIFSKMGDQEACAGVYWI